MRNVLQRNQQVCLTCRAGFGDAGGLWLGLERLHNLTAGDAVEMRVDMEYQGSSYYAQYATFAVASEADNFRLTVSNYSGTAGDSFTYHDGMLFTTLDRDNDAWSDHCALRYTG